MNINIKPENAKLTVVLGGRINTSTAPEFESSVSNLDGIEELVLDFEKVQYISSAGLRVLIKTAKTMKKQGSMKLIKVNESVMDVFEIAGLAEILTIE